jgi:hypothetical protein
MLLLKDNLIEDAPDIPIASSNYLFADFLHKTLNDTQIFYSGFFTSCSFLNSFICIFFLKAK